MIQERTFLTIVLLVAFTATQGQTWFGNQQVISSESTAALSAKSVFTIDLDGDGDMDVLSASSDDDKIAWYENTDGNGNFGPQIIITTDAEGACSVFAADLDGDGDMDVPSASSDDDKIAWYENTDGNGNFGPQIIITTDAEGACSVYAADIDGDGNIDVLSASKDDNKIAWYDNINGNGNFGQQQVIDYTIDWPKSVCATDIDGDGDKDVVASFYFKIVWYENIDGDFVFLQHTEITNEVWGYLSSISTEDIDGDGDIDVISASSGDDKIAWNENTDGNGNFGQLQIISTDVHEASSVFAVDIDGDLDLDVISASSHDGKIAWYENTDGNGNFGPQMIITTDADYARSVFAEDMDGDGDIDVAAAVWNKIAWYENTDGIGNFSSMLNITISTCGTKSIYSVDIDGDNDMDILSASSYDNQIPWYENINVGESFNHHIVSNYANRASSVFAEDVDGDGDMDVLSASSGDDKIAWYENTDGIGSFSSQNIITTSADGASSVYATDIDMDGDIDVLSASFEDDKIAWYENTDGNGSFGPQKVISTAAWGPMSVYAEDIDGDEDMDVLSASYSNDKIAWYENTDGNGNFGPQITIPTGTDYAFMSVYAEDVDGDGDMDVLSASFKKIAWNENLDGIGTFSNQKNISSGSSGSFVNSESVYTADLDNDGDLDVISTNSSSHYIACYENTNGSGSFSQLMNITDEVSVPTSVYATDLDNDGDLDVISGSNNDGKVAWYENIASSDIKEFTQNFMKIYPNPTTGKISLDFNNKINFSITILDLTGKTIFEKIEIQQNETIDLSGFEMGIYICRIHSDEEVFITKIVKK